MSFRFFGFRSHRGTFHALFLAFALLLIWSVFVQCDYTKRPTPIQLSPQFRRLQAHVGSSSASSNECKVPKLNPYDPSILEYIETPKPLQCDAVQPQMAKLSADGVLQFNATLFASASCSYRTISHNEGVDDTEAKYGDSMPIELDSENRFKFEHEMIEVECNSSKTSNSSMYKMQFAQVVPRARALLCKLSKIKNSSVERPSVIIIGIDSMSRSNFLRQLKKTHAKMRKMGFIDMKNHVKIGDNTYPNWVAILTGKRSEPTKELPAEFAHHSANRFYDDDEMVWHNFSRAGHATMLAEDCVAISTFNYYARKGFQYQPTDHYFRPYWIAAVDSNVSESCSYCHDTMGKHRIQLDYLASFLRAYEGKRKFAFWWTNVLSHDYLNDIGKGDEDFANFLVENAPLFNESIVVFISDHGHRYGGILNTIIGRLENSLPFLSIRIPPAVDSRFPHLRKILRQNSKKMTTQFDMNESLNVLVKGEIESIERKVKWTKQPRAFSLFHSIPNRSCLEAQIPDDYCPCYVEKEIPLKEAKQPAKVMLEEINKILSSANTSTDENLDSNSSFVCAPLELADLAFASVRMPPTNVIEDPRTTVLEIKYRIMLETKPSGALFGGVVIKEEISGNWSTTGEFERYNRYGNTSHCVSEPELKKLCFCVATNSSTSLG